MRRHNEPPPGEPRRWRVDLTRRAQDDLKRLSRTDRQRIEHALDDLRVGRGDVRRLREFQGAWRLRVGDWRVIFTLNVQTHVIQVLAVRPRGSAYR